MSDDTEDLMLEEDFSIDDVEDLPGFLTPPTGGYVVSCEKGVEEQETENAEGEKNTFFRLTFKIVTVMEIDEKSLDAGEAPPKEGDMFSLMYMKNKKGVAFMKPLLSAVAEHYQIKQFSEIKEKFKGIEMLLAVKRRYNKKADRHNLNVVQASVT